MSPDFSALTRGLRTGLNADPRHAAVVPPIYPSTTFSFPDGIGPKPPYDYSRCSNPTRDVLGDAIATLEGGAGAVITSSGMAAITVAMLALVTDGGTVVAPKDCYGGTWRLLNELASRRVLEVVYVEQRDFAALEAALDQAAVVLIETPTNPLLRLVDLEASIAAAHDRGVIAVVDNTFCSPVRQRPMDFGADVVIHSTTKFINGHSDVVGGAVVSATGETHEHMAHWANVIGATASSFDSWFALRGLRTLDARVRVNDANTARIAEVLQSHPAVSVVYWPGLTSHPQHELATRQQRSYGSLVSFELIGGLPAVEAFVDGLELFILAESLGGVESLVAHPVTMTHTSMTPEAQLAAGISESLLRLSVGIEPIDDLVTDLTAALDRAVAVSGN